MLSSLNSKLFGLSLVLLLLSSLVQAADVREDKKNAVPDGPQDISVDLKHDGNLTAETESEEQQADRASRPKRSFELSVTSWQPKNLVAPSRIAVTSPFSSTGVPDLNVNMISPLSRRFSLRFGVGLVSENRTGTLNTNGIGTDQTQTVYLSSVRVGAEYVVWENKTLHPYVDAALLPSFQLTGRSAFDDGTSPFGLPVEFGAGTLVRLSKSFDLNVGINETVGKIKDSNVEGFAFLAALRTSL